ncbi:outer membrane protein [Geomesophilobacter sediminis]|uniref:Porin family protein n=1 Tax=Geomesophilobacter sediminis TaxID=2798584 RepID=A0A8J7JL88_9BACT|nr:outer membrane beta-barrel protein [Geomesophilobacter sediminis]MBJ6724610.1 porin family protein [Geomesophilobacter sediminis]
MKLIFVVAGLLVGMFVTTAMASGPYLGAAGGVAFYHDGDLSTGGTGEIQYNPGIAATAALGYDFGVLRGEAEFGYRNAKVDTFATFPANDMDTTFYSYMGNVYWDFKTRNITPFVGGGVGLLHGRFTDHYNAFTDSAIGYQLLAGMGLPMTRHLNLDVTYKYQAAAQKFHVGVYDITYASSNVFAGLRYSF